MCSLDVLLYVVALSYAQVVHSAIAGTVQAGTDTEWTPLGGSVYTVWFSTVTDGLELDTLGNLTVTVLNDDVAQPGSIFFSVSEELRLVEGGVSQTYLGRTGGSDGPACATLVLPSQSGHQSLQYYVPSVTTVSWAHGDSAVHSVQIQAVAVSGLQPMLRGVIGISIVSGNATVSAPATRLVAVSDNEAPHGLARLLNATTVVVADAQQMRIGVERVYGSNNRLVVGVSVIDGTATNGSDVIVRTAMLSWEAGFLDVQWALIEMQGSGGEYEPAETFSLTLTVLETGGTEYSLLGHPSNVSVVILEHDRVPGCITFVENGTVTLNEGGSIVLHAARVGGKDGVVSAMLLQAGGSATSGDYSSVPAMGTQLTWNNGNDDTLTVTISADDEAGSPVESDSFVLMLASPCNCSGTPLVVSIHDIILPAGVLAFVDAPSMTVKESADTQTVSVSRTGGSDGAVSVKVALVSGEGDAVPDSDFVFSNSTLTWDNDDSSTKTATVIISVDGIEENAESFFLELVDVTGAALSVVGTTLEVIIADERRGIVGMVSCNATVVEGATLPVVLQRVSGSVGPLTVSLATAPLTAVASVDYVPFTDNIAFADGITEQTISIVSLNRYGNAGPRSFSLLLSAGSETLVGGCTNATVHIQPLGATVCWNVSSLELAEGTSAVVYVTVMSEVDMDIRYVCRWPFAFMI